MDKLDFGIFDCDTHCYETRDACTRYLPQRFLDRAVHPVINALGQEVVLADRQIATFTTEQVLGFDHAARPGSLKEMLKEMASGNPDETYNAVPMRPEWVEREPRLKLMEQQGVDKAVLFPATMAFSMEHYIQDTEALYANIHSFNRWFNETWGFNYQDRIYATALMSLRDLDEAVKEVEHVIDLGARTVLVPTGPAHGRSPGDPYFDPVWSRLNEAGVTLAFHIQPFWYLREISPAWGLDPDPKAYSMTAWQWCNLFGERPMQDTLSSVIFDNLFGRFPNLMALVSEYGASWVAPFAKQMDKARGMGRNGPWIGGKLTERPSEILRQRVRIAPYPEDDVPRIVADLGQSDSIVMGSDFPHAEGLAEPADFAKLLDPLSDTVQRQILRDNALSVFAAR